MKYFIRHLLAIITVFISNSYAAEQWHDFTVEKNSAFYVLTTPQLKVSSTLKRAETKKITRKLFNLIKNIDYVYPLTFNKINDQLKCFIFQEKRDYFKFVKNNQDYSAKYAGGYFNPQRGEMVLFWKGNRNKTLQVLLHETAHYFTRKSFKQVPQAINEGLSTYFEVCGTSSSSFEIGTVNRYYLNLFIKQTSNRTLLPLNNLLSTRGYSHNSLEQGFTENQYAQSWALVWFCLSGPIEDVRINFRRYLNFVTQNPDPHGTIFNSMVIQKTSQFHNTWLKTMLNRSLKPTAFPNKKV